MKTPEELIDFIDEIKEYLFSWLCIYTGEYKLKCNYYDFVDLYRVHYVLKLGLGEDIIKQFKEDVLSDKIYFITKTNDIIEKHKDNLYRLHKERVDNFESKYNMV